jgi:Fe-S-cluster containining protein
MPRPPPCKSLGKHCREINLTIRISDIDDESQNLQDASVTWMTGHNERITFGKPYIADRERRVDATIHVPCKYLKTKDGRPAVGPNGRPVTGANGKGALVRCSAHRFKGPLPRSTQARPERRDGVQLGNGKFSVFYKGKRRSLDLRLKKSARRMLPLHPSSNPCVGAPCRTGDNVRGAACCRDFTLELHVPETQKRLEALLRARKSPYLCKVKREDDDTMECEVISACDYLDGDGISCILHNRTLPNGWRAKPSLCYEWPELGKDETGHPGCRLI